jgi:hypothetical protein
MFGGRPTETRPATTVSAVAALVPGSPCLAVGAPARLVSSGARMRLLVDAA